MAGNIIWEGIIKKEVVFNGSHKKEGNTYNAIKTVVKS